MFFEKYTPILLSLLSTSIFLACYKGLENPTKLIEDLVDSSFVINGVLIGFLLTITTLLHSITTRRMGFVKSLGGYGRLIRYLNLSLYLNLISLTIYLFQPLINFVISVQLNLWIEGFLFFLILYTWTANVRFTLMFISLLADGDD